MKVRNNGKNFVKHWKKKGSLQPRIKYPRKEAQKWSRTVHLSAHTPRVFVVGRAILHELSDIFPAESKGLEKDLNQPRVRNLVSTQGTLFFCLSLSVTDCLKWRMGYEVHHTHSSKVYDRKNHKDKQWT